MSEVLNLKHTLPERLHGRYISEEQIVNPTFHHDHDTDMLAHVLVSERHGKFDLVHLVAYLLKRAAQKADDADPLQGAANWIVECYPHASPTVIGTRLLIGYSRAERLFDAAIAQQRKGE